MPTIYFSKIIGQKYQELENGDVVFDDRDLNGKQIRYNFREIEHLKNKTPEEKRKIHLCKKTLGGELIE